jgi:uridine phosphorylase
MARKEFQHHEAVSAAVPGEGGYSAAIAVKGLGAGGAPTFHRVLDSQTFKTALAADQAAVVELERLIDMTPEGELMFAQD